MSPSTLQVPPPTALAGAEDIRDIRGLLEITSPWDLVAWAGRAALALLLILLAARWFWRAKPLDTTPSPDQIAFAALEQARHWMTPSQSERFGTAVSQAVRHYVEDRFGINAPRRTTEEFLQDLTHEPEPQLGRHASGLRELLQKMDLVKFARSSLDETQMKGLLDSASDFVRTTSPDAGEPEP